ncbi:MAG TPA: TonB-dependent receptor plug domain-containing protein, partial [Acidobacteriota bacterium]|nr:TonB-dependent receptor plug domain-containing protein [Acidobacteriota bacterium]
MRRLWIFCILLSAVDISAAELNGKVSGCVSDDSGGGLPGVQVSIAGSRLQQAIQIYTDSGGCYNALVPAGTYQMMFRLLGFGTEEKNDVIVYAEREAIVDRTLRISLKAELTVSGRKPLRDIVEESDNLIGVADSASQGAVRYEQLALRPLLRPGELLETVPGVIISQHSGQGKANQYYLRGFNLDHGTDLAVSIDGIPTNFPSHGHGHGYSDLNFLIPELVNDVQFKKGPYYAEDGDFSSAGAIRIDYASTVNETIAGIEGGSHEYARGLFVTSPRIGKSNVLFALELFHNNGPWENPDGYRKSNGLFRYTFNDNDNSFSLTGMGYAGRWNSTDQIPSRLIGTGFSRFATIDPSDGGET